MALPFLSPLLTTIVALFFVASLARQYVQRRKTHQLIWACGFLLFAFAVGLEAHSELLGWGELSYRLYSSTLASLVAMLGAGSVYLLAGKRWGDTFLAYAVIMSIVVAYVSFTVPIDGSALVPGVAAGARGMPTSVRLLYPLLTIPGSIALILGSIVSWGVVWRKTGTVRNEKSFNLFIACGALVVASSGGLAKGGHTEFLYIGELLGISLMYIGFVRSKKTLVPLS